MRHRLLALAALALTHTAAAKAPTASAPVCVPHDEALPFPLPSDEVSEGWGDDDFERWEAAAWRTYCRLPAGRNACECRR